MLSGYLSFLKELKLSFILGTFNVVAVEE